MMSSFMIYTVRAKHFEKGWMHVHRAIDATEWMGRDQWVNYDDPEEGYYETEDFEEWETSWKEHR